MDVDLVAEIERLLQIYGKKGRFAFLCECQDAWMRTERMWQPSPLFALCSPDGKLRMRRDGMPLGCPFSIRRSQLHADALLYAWTEEWTDAIPADVLIPSHEAWMRPESLVALAEWQQKFRDHFRERKRAAQRNSARRRLFLLRHLGP
jgi:hypothetical protein